MKGIGLIIGRAFDQCSCHEQLLMHIGDHFEELAAKLIADDDEEYATAMLYAAEYVRGQVASKLTGDHHD